MRAPPGWATLTEDESVIWHGRPVIYPFLRGILVGLVVVWLGLSVSFMSLRGQPVPAPLPAALPLDLVGSGLLLFGLALLARALLEWWHVRYLVTTEEVYKKRGVVARTVTNLPLRQIQNTSFTQGILGRILSYGHVRIDTAGSGGTEIVLRYVPDPADVVGTISRHLERHY